MDAVFRIHHAFVFALAAASLFCAPATAAPPPKGDQDAVHLKAGFPLTGGHRKVQCSSCHVRGVFKGTPKTCANCHNGTLAAGKGSTHVPSSNTCDSCHVSTTWTAVRFDHSSITTSCSSCHNGRVARGKGPRHISTSNTCDACHVTTNWTRIDFDHSDVTGTCATCHNGISATGKKATHIASTNNCDSCHVTTKWTTVNVDHADVTGSCSSCHNGARATGKPVTHIQTAAQCDACHSTVAWTPASFDHSAAVTGSCSTCHNGTSATGKTATHFTTTLQCDSCHNIAGWTPIRFTHATASYPGDHGSGVTCAGCHATNSQVATWSSPAFKPDCAGCHAKDFESDEHTKYDRPSSTSYGVNELRDCTGSCHLYSDSSLTTIEERRNGEHRPSESRW